MILFAVWNIIVVRLYYVLFIIFGKDYMEYLSIKQTSEKWGISVRRIQVLCSEGRIPGAMKIGSYWAIPADAEKPSDERIKSGKYIKEK
ncbi:MAG: helix-turn-helix domain-containing protein [Prevotella fusca]